MDLKSSSITADILNVLMDGKRRTLQEIADEVEVSKTTVQRHVQSLSYRYPIETFRGGREKLGGGGVYLDKAYIVNGRVFTRAELQFGAKVFGALQRDDYDEDEQKALDTFVRLFAAQLKEKESQQR